MAILNMQRLSKETMFTTTTCELPTAYLYQIQQLLLRHQQQKRRMTNVVAAIHATWNIYEYYTPNPFISGFTNVYSNWSNMQYLAHIYLDMLQFRFSHIHCNTHLVIIMWCQQIRIYCFGVDFYAHGKKLWYSYVEQMVTEVRQMVMITWSWWTQIGETLGWIIPTNISRS